MKTVSTISLPSDEDLRLADLDFYEILDTPPEKEYDELMELAAKISGCPIALISFIDKNRQWYKSGPGFAGKAIARETSFCTYAILHKQVMVVKDPLHDERFYDHPEVTGGLGVRFYAGAPIVSMAGHNLGTICVIDKKEHSFSAEKKSVLALIAGQVSKLLELRVKNKLLRHHAEKLLNKEKLTLHHALIEHENEREYVRHELHENYAQVIAAVSLNLEMAAALPEQRTALLQKTKHELKKLLTDIHGFTDPITPVILHNMEAGLSLPDFVKHVSAKYAVPVDFRYRGILAVIQNDKVLAISRIIQLSMELVKNNSSGKGATINLKINRKITLEISSSVFSKRGPSPNPEILFNSILRRAELHLGTTNGITCKRKGQSMIICLPL